MAMDDFASAAELKSAAADSNLDEDLFDFPAVDPPESAPAAAEAPPAQAQPAATPAVSTNPTASAAPAPTTGGFTGMDPELDEDIFDFPPLEDTQAAERLTIAGGDLEASIDQATQTVNDLLEDDLGEMIQDHHEELERKRAVEEAAASAVHETPARPASRPEGCAPVAAAPAAGGLAVQTVAVAGPASRVQLVLVGAIITFMVGVLGIAWKLTSTFSSSLERVRDDVEESTMTLQTQNTEQMERIDQLEAELLAQQALARQAADAAALNPQTEAPSAMRTPSELTLLAAQAAIDAGDGAAARQMLFRDLANADAIPAQERELAIERMEFLVARSFQIEAQGLTEEGR